MQVCRIGENHLREALDLVWEVFLQFDAPDYEEMGIKTFQHFISTENMREKMRKGEMKFWGCYLNNFLVGVVALREGQHISLLFVRKQFQRLGIAARLLKMAIGDLSMAEPKIRAVTVNSSPYAVEFYKKMGFVPLAEEKRENGIRFTSMRYNF